MARATCTSTRSPAAWPWESLTRLSPSTSSTSSANGLLVALGERQRLPELRLQVAQVRQAGERVGVGQRLELARALVHERLHRGGLDRGHGVGQPRGQRGELVGVDAPRPRGRAPRASRSGWRPRRGPGRRPRARWPRAARPGAPRARASRATSRTGRRRRRPPRARRRSGRAAATAMRSVGSVRISSSDARPITRTSHALASSSRARSSRARGPRSGSVGRTVGFGHAAASRPGRSHIRCEHGRKAPPW